MKPESRKPRKNKASRGHPIIDLEEVERLAALNCTYEEIAAFFDVSKKAVEHRWETDERFRELIERGRAKGRISVRRAQIRMMQAGNATMAIWLGKQLLGQRDVIDTNINATQNIQHSIDLKALTTDELITWQKLLDKASGDVIDVQAVEEPHTNGKIKE